MAVWAEVYRAAERHFDLCELAEALADLEEAFRTWRFRRRTTAQRIIGQRPGTGGSRGVASLKGALERRFPSELWAVRTRL